MDDEQFNEQVLASAVRYLFQTGQKTAANLLLSGSVERAAIVNDWFHGDQVDAWSVLLRGSPVFYKEYYEYEHTLHKDIPPDDVGILVREAFRAVLPPPEYLDLQVRSELVEIDTDWRVRLLAEEETGKISNQNPYEKEPIIWQGIKFGSEGELNIAKELERLGIMYLPTCLARVGKPGNLQTRFPDILICYEGKWGVLEIDGKKYHTPESATADHNRRRLFEQHGGIAFFDRYPYSRCMNEPQEVVKEFLSILATK